MTGWFHRLDWIIAWRHLRTTDERAPWVAPLLFGSLYVVLVGLVLMSVASTLDPAAAAGPFEPPTEALGPTPLQSYLRIFGFVTAVAGAMALTFGLLARFFNLLPTIITMSVALGCMALVVVLSLMSGLEGDMRDKILAQKAHIRVSREDARPFADYPALAAALEEGEGIAGASPYLEGEIMVRSGINRQGALVVGIDPERHKGVSNLETIVKVGSYDYLSAPENIPEPDPFAFDDEGTPWRLRHLDEARGDGAGDTALPGVEDLGPPVDLEPAAEDHDTEDDGAGWEDPAAALDTSGRQDSRTVVEDARSSGLLGALTQESKRTAARSPFDDPPVEDGWEDPTAFVETPEGESAVAEKLDEPTAEDIAGEPEIDDGVGQPILIGRELMMELGVRVGEDVQLITPIGRTTPLGQVPGVLGAKVAGAFFSGMYEYDRKNVYAPLDVVQRFLLVGDRVSGIEVKLDDIEQLDQGKAEVERIVASLDRNEELIVEDWRDLNRNLFSAMFLEKVAMFIALLFVVLVASFGILASNLMSVMEKSKEIAILKAMGSTDGSILRVFVAEGLCVGMLGSFGGIAQGITLCWGLDHFGLLMFGGVFYVEKLPVVVNPVEVVLIGIAALVIVCISSLYPALVASRLRPVDGLRQAET